ncbi:MAG: glucose-6-phosphate isomerase family protein [Bdellovibrionota bacterium]
MLDTLERHEGRTLPMRPATLQVDLRTGLLSGNPEIQDIVRTLGDLKGIFRDEKLRSSLPQTTPIYSVQTFLPVKEGTEGALFWGTTFIEPGTIGGEYHMTKGHFHAKLDRTEFYMGVEGEGALILMDESGRTWWERMHPGSVHAIPGRVAHRVANTGKTRLSFLACWPSDAGHDYETIARDGFGGRLMDVDGVPSLIEEKRA